MTYKHVLFPVWIASYRYRSKIYRFLINGQTGEVQGQAPVSWIKITLVVLLVIIIVAVVFILLSRGESEAALNLRRVILGVL
jgi:Ni,Fe-hydrogenase I cytochrome b subunit